MNLTAEGIYLLVNLVDSVGWFTIHGMQTSVAWTIAAILWVVAWALMMRRRNLLLPLLGVLVGWLVIDQLPDLSGC